MRRTTPRSIADQVEKVIEERLLDEVRRRIDDIRDSKTGAPVTVSITSRDPLSFELSGSAESVQRARERLPLETASGQAAETTIGS